MNAPQCCVIRTLPVMSCPSLQSHKQSCIFSLNALCFPMYWWQNWICNTPNYLLSSRHPFFGQNIFLSTFFARPLDLCSYLSVRHYSAQMVTLLSYTPLVCCTVGVIMVIILAAISISQVFSCVDFTIKLTYKVQLFLDSQSISEERYINQISK